MPPPSTTTSTASAPSTATIATIATMDAKSSEPLPEFCDELRRRYLRGESCQFVLHGNVHDLVLHGGQTYGLVDFLGRVLLGPSKSVVAHYNLSSGVRFIKKTAEITDLEDLILARSPDKALPAIERMLTAVNKVAVIIDYAEMLTPAADTSFSSETERQSVISLHRWSTSPVIERSDNLVLLITENLTELNPKLVSNPKTATLRVPMPNEADRAAYIAHLRHDWDAAFQQRIAEVTAGLRRLQLKALLEPAHNAQDDKTATAERQKYIRQLLGASASNERIDKLADLTRGMGHDEIRALVAPDVALPSSPGPDDQGRTELYRLIFKRKREIIERECFGLIEMVDAPFDFSVVGGMDEVKRELLLVAENLREGRRSRCPMGLLFTGPMGTGKTFVAEAFVKETGLTAIKLKNFRSKWVGATEGNLERILSVVQALGQVIVIIDEGDRAFGGQDGGEGDGGTSSRVIARLKEFMSDTSNRGRVLFILMTNRPDKLDVDIKRAGRLDKKIPFLYPQVPEEVESVLAALLRKHKVSSDITFPRDRELTSARLVGYSNAELEAVVLMAMEYAGTSAVTTAHLDSAISDYLPSRDTEMLEYMELLAVFEASSRRMLPKKYEGMGADELQARLNGLRVRVGGRR